MRDVSASDPQRLQATLQRATRLHRDGRLAEAERAYHEVLQLDPDNVAALHFLGVLGVQSGRPDEGLSRLRRAIALHPDAVASFGALGQILNQLGRFREAAPILERAVSLQPEAAGHRNALGVALQALGRPEEALAQFDQAIALKPDFAEAYGNRAIVLRARGDKARVLEDLRRAAALRPNVPGARYNLALAFKDLRRFESARAELVATLALRPDYPEAFYDMAVCLAEERRTAEALDAFDRAIGLRPDYAAAHFGKGLALLQLGRFEEGFPECEWRKRLPTPLGRLQTDRPEWLGDGRIAGETLLLHGEQGLGDTLMFARYARLAAERGARVVLSAPAPLQALLTSLGPAIRVIAEDETPPPFDRHSPLMSLPLAFGTTAETIPTPGRYLSSDDGRRARWAARLPRTDRRRIGFVWASSRKNVELTQRSVGLSNLLPLVSPDADWISLQKDATPEEVSAFRTAAGLHFADEFEDFADTAAVIDQLDLVVTVDTAAAHLAGAMGRPVWILLACNPDWRWFFDRTDSPWYPSARLFRQPSDGDWGSVVEAVKAKLTSWLRESQPGR